MSERIFSPMGFGHISRKTQEIIREDSPSGRAHGAGLLLRLVSLAFVSTGNSYQAMSCNGGRLTHYLPLGLSCPVTLQFLTGHSEA